MPHSPSDPTLLRQSWEGYLTRFVTPEGRVLRPENGDDTVSEGQAYTMLRAIWMNDQATFDRVWNWTRANLQRTGRPAPTLMAWHWTPADGGSVVDWNVATDADTNLALALVMAGNRWRVATTPGTNAYHDAARTVLADLAGHAVVDVEGARLMLPGTWANQRVDGRRHGAQSRRISLRPHIACSRGSPVTRDGIDLATGPAIRC